MGEHSSGSSIPSLLISPSAYHPLSSQLLFGLLFVAVLAQKGFANDRPAVIRLASDEQPAMTLDELKQRDPAARWEELKARLLPEFNAPPASAPLAQDVGESISPFQPVSETTISAGIPAPEAVPLSEQLDALQPDLAAPASNPLRPAESDLTPPPSTPSAPVQNVSQQTPVVPEPVPPAPPPPNGGMVPPAPSGGPKAITAIVPFYNEEIDADIRQLERPFGADAEFTGRFFPQACVTWEASNFYHFPLYFEDVALERYGHTHHECLQPFVSAGKFTAQLLGLPYSMTIDPICKHMYVLGYYMPGECAPYLCYQIPFNARAAAVTGAFYTGMFFLIP